MAENNSVSIGRLILVPALITLGVTLLRLVGELQHWPSPLFSTAPGGAGAIVGISWLPFIFGPYFALKLASAGERPASLGKAIGFTVLGLVVMIGGAALFGMSKFQNMGMIVAGAALIVISFLIPLKGWSQLTKALIAYGYLARIPVAIVNFLALRGNWHTHYDGLPPNFPEMAFGPKYLAVGLMPQVTGWIAFTVMVGSLVGIAATAIARRKVPAHATT